MSTVEIQLTRGYTALISQEDYELVSAHKWHAALRGSGKIYAATKIKDASISEREAAIAYDAAALVLFGKFAVRNYS